jgi:regulator of protease activity HflC (stomatin/prohibitin superfamily)
MTDMFTILAIVALLATIVIGALMWGMPKYGVYSSRLSGVASLAEAQAAAEVRVREARAERDAATLEAEAEVERAKGVSKATEIIGKALHENEGYLRYLWIERLNNQDAKIIYIPTEAGLPILEAGRRSNGKV